MHARTVDHAVGEHKRVECLQVSIRALMGDPQFELTRADCFHHKGGLIANAAQRADNGVIVNKVATKLDQQIKQFKASNAMSMFQRQIVLVFSPLENYVFGSGKIDFPMWFPKNVLISGLLQWTEKLVIDIASHSRTQ